MRAIIQRVKKASVTVQNQQTASIQHGLLILLGVEAIDTQDDIAWLSGKIARLRIFDDENGLMNKSVQEVNGEAIVVSQFTLYASTKKGNRPSYTKAAKPDISVPLYEQFVAQLQTDLGKPVGTGTFGAHMQVELLNDGPVTIIIDTQNKE